MHYACACCSFSVEGCQHISIKLLPILQNPVQSALPQQRLLGPFIINRITTSCSALPEHIIQVLRGTQQGHLVLPRKEDQTSLPERKGVQAETERRGRQRAAGRVFQTQGTMYAKARFSSPPDNYTLYLSVACVPSWNSKSTNAAPYLPHSPLYPSHGSLCWFNNREIVSSKETRTWPSGSLLKPSIWHGAKYTVGT